MEHEELLEKIFLETYKRESDESENVARTLPFFATSLAIVVTVLGYVMQHIPHVTHSAWAHVCYMLILLASIALVGVLGSLLRAVWPRSYRLLPPETELLSYSNDLLEYYLATPGTENASIETRDSIRTFIIRELASATTNNRINNANRIAARTQAFFCLLAALLCALLLGAIMFVADGVASSGRSAGQSHVSNAH